MSQYIRIYFDETSLIEAEKLAKSFQRYLQLNHLIQCERITESLNTLSGGDAIQIILNSGAIVALSTGIAAFLKSFSGKKITIKKIIKDKNGHVVKTEVIVSGLSGGEAKEIIQNMLDTHA